MPIVQRLRTRARQTKRQVRAIVRGLDFRRMTDAEFGDLLVKLGFRAGTVVMIHSSVDSILRRVPTMTPMRLIEVMKELLGPTGTLLMPTFPFTGLQVDYAATNKVFDVHKTPSRMGLMTEIFRRSPGVRRSLHPTHPVAGWGEHTGTLLDTHHIGTAFGESSPFCKMRSFNGVVVGVGVSPHSFTLLHAAEELHPKTFEHQYETTPRTMTIVDGEKRISYDFFALRADRVREYSEAIKILESEGILRHETHGGLQVCATEAGSFIYRALRLIDKGAFGV